MIHEVRGYLVHTLPLYNFSESGGEEEEEDGDCGGRSVGRVVVARYVPHGSLLRLVSPR